MPKLLVSDIRTGVRIPITPLYVCEFSMTLSFRLSTKKKFKNKLGQKNRSIKKIFIEKNKI
jgi:hypothetical protein